MTKPAQTTAYQATDLARSHRQVLDKAREGGALVRDKDGVALLVAPAEEVDRQREIADLALDLVRVGLAIERGERSPISYGDMGWLSVLPPEAQRRCLGEMSEALLIAAAGLSLRNFELLAGDWKATAESWADEDVRAQLQEGSAEPLHDVEL